MFDNHLDMRRPADDWTPDRIPFDKLYLLELRQVSTRVLQPVLYCDAAYGVPDVERSTARPEASMKTCNYFPTE